MNEQIQTIYMYQESRYVYLATDNEKEWELVVPRFSLLTIVQEQPSPWAFSARSILDSIVSCDVTERYSPRTPSQYCQIKYGGYSRQVITATENR